jgi:hypothetical protein
MHYHVLLIAPSGRPFQIDGKPVAGARLPGFVARLSIPAGWCIAFVECREAQSGEQHGWAA